VTLIKSCLLEQTRKNNRRIRADGDRTGKQRIKRGNSAKDFEKIVNDCVISAANREKSSTNRPICATDRVKSDIDREKSGIDREKNGIDREKTNVDWKKTADKPKKTALERKKTSLDPGKTAVNRRKTPIDCGKTSCKPEKTTFDREKTRLKPKKQASIVKKQLSNKKKHNLIRKNENGLSSDFHQCTIESKTALKFEEINKIMDSLQQRKLNKYLAETAYTTDNTADFPRDSSGGVTAGLLTEAILLIQTLAGRQSSQVIRQNIGIKNEALERLIKLLQKMNRAANVLGEEVESIGDRFRLPRRRTEKIWLAVGRAFYEDSAPFEAEFIRIEVPPTFRADLLGLIETVETAAREANIAGEQKGGATGGLIAAYRDAGKLSRRLDAIVRNKFEDDPRKLAAWAIASHLDAAPVREKPKPVQPKP
jgi:hypothetical protein